MAKITLGSAPKTFKHKFTLPLLDGSQGDITVTYAYRDRVEFAKFIDQIYPEIKAGTVEKVAGEGVDVVANAIDSLGRDADYLMQVIDGWDLAEEFNLDSATVLVKKFPLVSKAIMDGYRNACTEGKVKN